MRGLLIVGLLSFVVGCGSHAVLSDPLNYCLDANTSSDIDLVRWCVAYKDSRDGLIRYARANPEAVR